MQLTPYKALKIIKFDLIKFVNNYLEMAVSFNKNNIEFIYESPIIFVKSDKKLLGDIFNNLILNAFQEINTHTQHQQKVIITIKQRKIIYIEISNLILEEVDIKKIMEPGFSTKKYGSGIGLSIVKQLSYKLNIKFNIELKDNCFISRLRFIL